MNKAYRLVWSHRHGGFVAVPEIASARGKSNALVCVAALTLAALSVSPASAQVVPATGATTVTATSGAPVVGIATANGAGVSHNQYNQFNVDSKGLVLNNNAAADAVASQLAGNVARNANLTTGAAKLILNEVVSNNRSMLKGYMEVAGTPADVVVANPWGITCNGCGFINTDRATLSTGVPVWGGDGSLAGLRVNQGDIVINGTGLKGDSTNILDIVARSILVDGAITGNDLKLVAGSNDYGYASRAATPLAASGSAPTYAIDSTALGGMYAQRIAIVATENGVGVRTLGDVAARGSDFTLSAAGNIELLSKSISAANNIAVTAKTGTQTRTAADSTIEAGGRFSQNGGALDNQGRIVGAQGYQIDVTDLTNGSTTNSSARIASTLDDPNGVYGSSITSGGNVSNYGAIHSRGDLAISAQSITNQNTGGMTSRRALNLTAANSVDNRGALYSGGSGLNLQANTINNFTGGTIEAVAGIWSRSLVFNNYAVIRADTIGIETTGSFYNGLETPVTPVLDLSTTVASSENEAMRQIDFWQENKTCSRCDERWLFQDAVTYREKYSAALPAVKPQILALDTLTLNYGSGSATNYAGVLSGDLVSISGTGTFTNQDVSLAEVTYYRRAVDDKEDHWYWAYGSKHMYLAATAAIPLTNAALNAQDLKQLRANTPTNGSVAEALGRSALFEKSRKIYSSTGAGVYANALYVSAGQVKNLGSPLGFSDNRLAQGGFDIAIPTNPNGHYVANADPKSRYRVVTNPDFEDQAAETSSYELEKLLGYNPDDELMRLGDTNYEDYLIEQQMVAQGAASPLAGKEAVEISRLRANAVDEFRSQKLVYGDELTPDQIRSLSHDIVWMVKTTVGGKSMLVPRVYLSQATRAMLARGAVLAARDATTIEAAAVSNSGGTIAATGKLAVTTAGDITNTGGKMSGGDVSLVAQGKVVNQTTAQGAGNTRTFKTTLGKTGQIEATSGNLSINAGQQITVSGAEVKAAKDVSLTAVGAVTVENITNKTTASTSISTQIKGKKSKANTKKFENKTATSEQVVGSDVKAGNQLKITSGADVTVKGSTTTAGGGVAIQSQGDVKVIAEQNKTASQSVAKQSGRGVGGGLWGKKTQTTSATTSTNAGATVAAGGNASVQSGGELKLQGSQLKAAGNADIKAGKGIKVLAGKNESTSSTATQTTTFLKIGKGKDADEPAKKPAANATAQVKTGPGQVSATAETKTGDAQANAKANAKAEAKQLAGDVGAKAEAGAEANSKHDLKLFESTKTTQTSSDTQSVGSAIAVGGNLNASTGQTLKVEGSTANAGQAMNLNAGSVVVEAGTNTSQTSTQTSSFSLGIFEESKAKASAQAQAGARGGGAGAAANASASAKASADTTVTLGLKKESGSQATSATTHNNAALSSGSDMKVTAQGEAQFAGAKVDSGGNLDVKASVIANNAAQNTTTSTSSKESHLAGMYYSAEASAGASANAGAQAGIGAGAQAGAKAEAKAEVSKGLRYQNTQETETKSTTTQQTNNFSAQKDITRTAGDTIKDQGTQLQAGGSITQTARVITDQAVSSTTSTSKSSQTHDARLGVVAGASAEVGGSVSATVLGTGDSKPVKAEANAGVGVRAGYVGATGSSKEEKSTAVTSSYKAGKDVSTTSTEKTRLQGAKIEAGNNVNIQAGSLDVGAAKNTSSSSSNKNDINAQVGVTVLGTAGVDAKAGYKGKIDNATSSSDQVGSIKAGGNIAVNSGGDANFTGTQIKSDGKTVVNAQGDVNFNAAQSSSQSSAQDINANAGVKAGAGAASGNVGGGYARSDRSSTAGKGAKVDAKGGIDVNSGGNVNLQGTALKTAGDANVTAQGTVKLEETTKRETANSLNVGAGIKGKKNSPTADAGRADDRGAAGGGRRTDREPASGSSGDARGASSDAPGAGSGGAARTGTGSLPSEPDKSKPSNTGGNLGWSRTDKTDSTTTSVEAGGNVNIKAGTVANQEAKVSGTQVKIEGNLEKLKKTQKSSASGLEINAGMQTK